MGRSKSIDAAEHLARHAHRGQVDKAGQPYIDHPAAVALITAEWHPDDTDAIATAWLHDVVEDTSVTMDEIRRRFGATIAAAVDAITRQPGESLDCYYARVAADPIAARVKRADLHHNSDPARLMVLPPATQRRLVAKYRHAAEMLNELAGV